VQLQCPVTYRAVEESWQCLFGRQCTFFNHSSPLPRIQGDKIPCAERPRSAVQEVDTFEQCAPRLPLGLAGGEQSREDSRLPRPGKFSVRDERVQQGGNGFDFIRSEPAWEVDTLEDPDACGDKCYPERSPQERPASAAWCWTGALRFLPRRNASGNTQQDERDEEASETSGHEQSPSQRGMLPCRQLRNLETVVPPEAQGPIESGQACETGQRDRRGFVAVAGEGGERLKGGAESEPEEGRGAALSGEAGQCRSGWAEDDERGKHRGQIRKVSRRSETGEPSGVLAATADPREDAREEFAAEDRADFQVGDVPAGHPAAPRVQKFMQGHKEPQASSKSKNHRKKATGLLVQDEPEGIQLRVYVQVLQRAGLRGKQTATSALPVPRRALHPMCDQGRCRLYRRRKAAIPAPTRQRPRRIKPGSPMAGAAATNLGAAAPAHAAVGSKIAAAIAINRLAIVPSVEQTMVYSLQVPLSIGDWAGTRPALRVASVFTS
jgi:hypothetical protein